MATLTVTETFVNGATSDATEVNTNFNDIVTFVNANCTQKDGSLAFTANQSFGGFRATNLGTPSASTDAVTKAYVDALMGFDYVRWRITRTGSGGTITDGYTALHTDQFAMFSGWNTVDVAVFAYVAADNGTTPSSVDLQIRVDGADQTADVSAQYPVNEAFTAITMAEVETSEATIDVSLRAKMTQTGATADVKFVRMWTVVQRKA